MAFIHSLAHAKSQTQQISKHILFFKQPSEYRFYDSNQVLVQGDKCALLYDASGNFSAVEGTVEYLKTTLKTPLCYVVASHFHDDHLLGIAVVQAHFKDAKLIVHQQLAKEFDYFQQAFTDKLDSYQQSIELSYQRLAEQPASQRALWQDKLSLAKTRLLRWREYKLYPPALTVENTLTLDLGGYPISINAYNAHTRADLMLLAKHDRTLLGGDIVDYLPYPGHGDLSNWVNVLEQLINSKTIDVILPGHGNALTPNDLKQPAAFLKAILSHGYSQPEQDLQQLQQSFPEQFEHHYSQDEPAKKAYPLFLQAGLKRTKQSK
jgi:glyoxylase-like metal-dependent hydrolase (beta-lactamase superfamily II)